MAVKFNPQYQTSEGTYFKDPDTLRDFTNLEPRVISPKPEDIGSFVWPRVKTSSGDIVKIAFRLFNDEERACYKAYRQRGKAGAFQKTKTIAAPTVEPTATVEKLVAHSHVAEGSVPAGSTIDFIRSCKTASGVWIFEGIIYDLLHIDGSNSTRPVPRSLIPKEERIRLNIPV